MVSLGTKKEGKEGRRKERKKAQELKVEDAPQSRCQANCT